MKLRFLASSCVSCCASSALRACVSSLIIGSGRPAFTLPPVTLLDHALRPPTRVFHLGGEVRFDLALERHPETAKTGV